MKSDFQFAVKVETNDSTGEVMSVYFQIHKGQSVKVKEHAGGAVFADYDKRGSLLGIEMLAPCRASVLARIPTQPSAKRFVRDSVPRGMVLAK